MKTTSNERWSKNIKSAISQQPLVGFPPNFKIKLCRPIWSIQRLEMMMTSNGRGLQNIESGISQQPLVKSYPARRLEMKMTTDGRQPQHKKG